MFTPISSRSASAYKIASLEASVENADPHGLINLLFEGLMRSLRSAKYAMQNKDIPVKCKEISSSIRILQEGLIMGLNVKEGGALAQNLNDLYSYCVIRLVHANAKNDVAAVEEVESHIALIADGWKQIADKGPAYLRAV